MLVNTIWKNLLLTADWIANVCFFQSQFLLRQCTALRSKIVVSIMLE